MSKGFSSQFGTSLPVRFLKSHAKLYDEDGNEIIEKCGKCGKESSDEVYIQHVMGLQESFMICNICSSESSLSK